MSKSNDDVIEIRGRDLKLVGLALLCMLGTIGLLAFSYIRVGDQLVQVSQQAGTAAETHHGVCIFRANLEEQANSSQKYLEQHPDGAPALGITAAVIQQGIDKQRAAVEALSTLNCSS